MQYSYEQLKQIIQNRRSIYPASYINKEIPTDVIQEILNSANYAPTHKKTEPWRFVVLRGDAKIRLGQTLARLYKEKVHPDLFLEKKYTSFSIKAEQAGCIIAICVQYHPEKLPAWEEVAAVAAAVQNMALTATALGVGSYWSSPPLISALPDFLELSENQECIGLFYMGYHEQTELPVKRGDISLKVKWWDQ
ncbi:MAG: nitroreductase [Pedobacter sp.]|nr:MAG: nitroreductase [Pedobacter sp.]